MICFSFIPTVGEITRYGMQAIGILVGVIYGFATVGTMWAALAGIVALGIIGVMGQVVASALGTPMIWGVILIQVIMYALAKEGVTKFFANWIISRKVVKGRPWLYSFFVLLGAFIVAIVSPFPALLIFWDIVYATCDNFKQPHNCRWSQFMILGVTFSAGLGVVSLPMLTSNGITVFANYQAIAGESMNAVKYVIALVPLMLLSVGIYILLCKFVFKPDITPFKAIDVTIADQSALKLGRRQVIVMLAMLVLLLILFAPYLLPAEWGLTAFMSNLGLFGACAVIILALALIKVDGAPLLNIQEAASKNIQWGTVFMVALLMPLGNAISGADSGIMTTLTSVLSPVLLSDHYCHRCNSHQRVPEPGGHRHPDAHRGRHGWRGREPGRHDRADRPGHPLRSAAAQRLLRHRHHVQQRERDQRLPVQVRRSDLRGVRRVRRHGGLPVVQPDLLM